MSSEPSKVSPSDGPQFEVPIPLPIEFRIALTHDWPPREDGFVRVYAFGPPMEANCATYPGPGSIWWAEVADPDEEDMGLRWGWGPPGCVERLPEHVGW